MNNDKQNNNLYDPEIVSVILIVLGTIGAIGGVANTLDYIERKRNSTMEHHSNEKRKKYVELEVINSFRDLSFSIDIIRRRLEFLDKVCHGSLEIEDRFTERKFSFGNCPILLKEHEFRLFQKEQSYIFNEVAEIHKTIFIIEELITENQYLYDNVNYIVNKKLRYTLDHIIKSVNDLMNKFSNITIDEFLRSTIGLCRQIEEITKLGENLKNS
jgi:hypothetical protein